MAITAAMVKELREMTGAGMMDCKKALTKTEGDMDAAVEFLRENGLAKAAKKAGRIAAEGLVAATISDDAKTAAIVEVNSETDFVAKNDTFKEYVAEVAEQALTTEAEDIEAFLAEESKAEAGKTVKEVLDGKIAVIGENLNIRRFHKVSAEDGFVASYIHAGGKIGVLVEVATDVVNDEIKEMAKNVAMQVAAISPKYTSRDEVSKEYIDHETEILKVQAMNENPDKPENIIEKMIIGRLNKELKEAPKHGFRILQFNAVVASNRPALKLYKKLGFLPLGIIPKGFQKNDGTYDDIIPHYIELENAERFLY